MKASLTALTKSRSATDVNYLLPSTLSRKKNHIGQLLFILTALGFKELPLFNKLNLGNF